MARYSPISPTIPLPSNQKIEQVIEKIEQLSKHLEAVSENEKPILQSKLLTARLMKERLVAMTALAKAQVILAEMDVVTAENNLRVAVQELEHFELETDMKLPEALSPKPSTSPSVDVTTITQKEKSNKSLPEKKSKEIAKPGSGLEISSATANKENVNSNNIKVTTLSHDKGEKLHSQMPPTSDRKRKHSPSSKHHHKRSKKSHSSSKQTESTSKLTASTSKNTKLRSKLTVTPTSVATLSPLSTKSSPTLKTSTYMSQGVQTLNTLFQNDESQQLNNVSSRVLEDDEQTVIVETIDMSALHKDVVDVSKQSKLVPPLPSNMYCMQFPVSSQIQLMFEDDPPTDTRRKPKNKIKTEAPDMDMNTSTDNLVNELFKDIMESKRKQQSNQMINCSKVLPESDYFCKVTLRQILEQC